MAVKMIIKLSVAVSMAALLMTAAYSEHVFTKDGNIFSGKIVSDSAGSVTLKQEDRKYKKIFRNNIMRILYTELYMGKVHVQLTNGKSMQAYMVDEDRESYTFRIELFNPKEFTVKRDHVLFMARGNPSGLQGEAETKSVKLKWFPPYSQVKKYKIYMKEAGEEKYRFVDDSGSNSAELDELKSNTKYFIYVTAIDKSGDESMPSNELEIITKNIKPEEPEINMVRDSGNDMYHIIWKPALDPDGKIKEYRVYKEIDGKLKVINRTRKTEYSYKRDEAGDILYIASVDNRGDESERARVFFIKPRWVMGAGFAYALPIGKFSDIAGSAYGGSLYLESRNRIFRGFVFGVDASAFLFGGRDGFSEEENEIKSTLVVPLTVRMGYDLFFLKRFHFITRISAGALYLNSRYRYYNIVEGETEVDESELNPAGGFGLEALFDITHSFSLGLNLGYTFFREKSETYSFSTAGICGSFRF